MFHLFMICQLSAFSQEQFKNELGLSAGITRMDVFVGLKGERIKNRWHYLYGLEVGMNRTFFQQRMYPRMHGGVGYAFISGELFQLSAQLTYAYSLLKIYALSKHFNHWNECYGGLKCSFGKKIKGYFVVSGGWMNELYFNDLKNKYAALHSLGYCGNIGLSYAW